MKKIAEAIPQTVDPALIGEGFTTIQQENDSAQIDFAADPVLAEALRQTHRRQVVASAISVAAIMATKVVLHTASHELPLSPDLLKDIGPALDLTFIAFAVRKGVKSALFLRRTRVRS